MTDDAETPVRTADIIELLVTYLCTVGGRSLEPYTDVVSIVETGEKRMDSGRCLANAIVYATLHHGTVVVGYGTTRGGRRIAHAWVVDPSGRAIDVTWPPVHGVSYEGIPLHRLLPAVTPGRDNGA